MIDHQKSGTIDLLFSSSRLPLLHMLAMSAAELLEVRPGNDIHRSPLSSMAVGSDVVSNCEKRTDVSDYKESTGETRDNQHSMFLIARNLYSNRRATGR